MSDNITRNKKELSSQSFQTVRECSSFLRSFIQLLDYFLFNNFIIRLYLIEAGVGIHESFTNYIRNERVKQAATLLLSSELSIKEIAEATGFTSVHYFTRIFMKEKEMPPGQYRKRLRAEHHSPTS